MIINIISRRKNKQKNLKNNYNNYNKSSHHHHLSSAYEELVDVHIVTMTTRSAARDELTSISTNSRCYHQSFLPRTILAMRGHRSNNYY